MAALLFWADQTIKGQPAGGSSRSIPLADIPATILTKPSARQELAYL